MLQEKRKSFANHIIRAPNKDPPRQVTFKPNMVDLHDFGRRRIGGPKQNWIAYSNNMIYEEKSDSVNTRALQNKTPTSTTMLGTLPEATHLLIPTSTTPLASPILSPRPSLTLHVLSTSKFPIVAFSPPHAPLSTYTHAYFARSRHATLGGWLAAASPGCCFWWCCWCCSFAAAVSAVLFLSPLLLFVMSDSSGYRYSDTSLNIATRSYFLIPFHMTKGLKKKRENKIRTLTRYPLCSTTTPSLRRCFRTPCLTLTIQSIKQHY